MHDDTTQAMARFEFPQLRGPERVKMKEEGRSNHIHVGINSTFAAKRQSNADVSFLQLVSRVALRLILELLLEVFDKFGKIGFCISISHAVPGLHRSSELGACQEMHTAFLQGCA